MAIKVLVIDDDVIMLKAIAFILEDSGYDVVSCDNVDTSYHKIVENTPDLILLDLHVPEKKDAMRFIRTLKDSSHLSHVPVVYVTAENSTKEIEDCFISGGFDYIHKPFTKTKLLEKVAYVSSLGKANNTIRTYLDKFYVQ